MRCEEQHIHARLCNDSDHDDGVRVCEKGAKLQSVCIDGDWAYSECDCCVCRQSKRQWNASDCSVRLTAGSASWGTFSKVRSLSQGSECRNCF